MPDVADVWLELGKLQKRVRLLEERINKKKVRQKFGARITKKIWFLL